MLDDYIFEQEKVVKILKNSVLKKRVSHAYLFETNGYKNALNLAISFSKMLFCNENYSNNKKCNNCTICKNIDKRIFPELKIIEPDGLWIKKEQLDNLQKEFNEKSILSNKKIYIVNCADRLNKSASNSILKFLEEPEENIIAILITDNMHKLLDTIISRCQIISFSNNSKINEKNYIDKIKSNVNINENISNDKLIEIINYNIMFANFFETERIKTLIYTQSLWHNFYKDKEEILLAISILIIIYQDILECKINNTESLFHMFEIEKIKNQSITQLTKKISVLIDTKKKIDYNVNNMLLVDKMIIDLERCD